MIVAPALVVIVRSGVPNKQLFVDNSFVECNSGNAELLVHILIR